MPPARPQVAGFGLGAPAVTFVKSGEKGGLGCMAGAIFYNRRKKSGPGEAVGEPSGDALKYYGLFCAVPGPFPLSFHN